MGNRIVAFCPAWVDACALYRQFLPHIHTPNSKFIFSSGATPMDELADCNIVVVQRQCTENNVKALQGFREMGIKIVFDLDDNFWAMPAYNPGKKILESMHGGFEACIACADILTVSTNGLKTAVRSQFRQLKQEIVVVPNAVDFDLLHPPILPKGRGTVVGYAGTNTHFGDVDSAWDAITELVKGKELPDSTWFEFVGMPPPKDVISNPQIKTRTFVPVSEFLSRFSSWAWDISLAPLQETRFNISKSAIKVYEAAAVGIPILVSPVGPYAEFCKLDPELSYLQCGSKSQWKTKIKELVAEPKRRAYYAQKMLQVVKQYSDIRNVASVWQSVFDRVS